MTNTEAKMLAKQWVLGNRSRKASLTRKYDLKKASSTNTGRLKMGIRIDIENNPKDYYAAIDDDGGLVFFTGKPIKRLTARDLFTPPKATKRESTMKINHKLEVLKTSFPDTETSVLESFLKEYDFDLQNFSIFGLTEKLNHFVAERTEYQLVAIKKDGTELKSNFYKTENELSDMQQKCEDSDEYESTTVMKRIVDTDETEESHCTSNEDSDYEQLLKLTTMALKAIPHSRNQKEIIQKLNVLRKKRGMGPLKEKQVIKADLEESLEEAKFNKLDKLVKMVQSKDKKHATTFIDMLKKQAEPKKIAQIFGKMNSKSREAIIDVLSHSSLQSLLQRGEVVRQLMTIADEKDLRLDGRKKDFKEKIRNLGYEKKKQHPYEVFEEISEAPGRYAKKGDQDKYQWGDINKAMMAAGMNPSSVLKVLSKLRGKELKEAVTEVMSLVDIKYQLQNAKKDLVKAAKAKQRKEVSRIKQVIKDLEKQKKKYRLNADTEVEGEEVNESTLNYARTLKAIEKERRMARLSDKDKETLGKIADLMKKLKEEDEEESIDEAHLGISNFRKLSDKERKDHYDLINLALKQVPLSPKRNATVAKINKIRAKAGLQLIKASTDLTKIDETGEIQEKKIAGLVKKADKSGISYSILKQVYNRGMAAWKTGHRPGTTPQQWAFARVNSFITGGKTRTTADKDLWAKHRGKKESTDLDEYKVPSNYAAMMARKRKKAGTSEFGKSKMPPDSNIAVFKNPNNAKRAASKQKYKVQVFVGPNNTYLVPSTPKEAGQMKKAGYKVYA